MDKAAKMPNQTQHLNLAMARLRAANETPKRNKKSAIKT
jgi:hypothetical protein